MRALLDYRAAGMSRRGISRLLRAARRGETISPDYLGFRRAREAAAAIDPMPFIMERRERTRRNYQTRVEPMYRLSVRVPVPGQRGFGTVTIAD